MLLPDTTNIRYLCLSPPPSLLLLNAGFPGTFQHFVRFTEVISTSVLLENFLSN